MIDTIGGKKAASNRLDSLFVRLDAGYDDHYFAAGNEPDFQVPWIYNWTDRPYKTSETVHRILNEMYKRQNKLFPFLKTFCARFCFINTKQNVHFALSDNMFF